jgi:hypothetical protein
VAPRERSRVSTVEDSEVSLAWARRKKKDSEREGAAARTSRVATVKDSEVSLAWARRKKKDSEREGAAARTIARRHREGQRGLVGVGAKEEEGQREGEGGRANDRASPPWRAARSRWRGREGRMTTTTAEVTATTAAKCRGEGAERVSVGIDDNYCEVTTTTRGWWR